MEQTEDQEKHVP
jgi:small nuclear ribonucleoprotein D2